jgi:hypothetical protein
MHELFIIPILFYSTSKKKQFKEIENSFRIGWKHDSWRDDNKDRVRQQSNIFEVPL